MYRIITLSHNCRSVYRITASRTADLPKAQPSAIVAGIDRLQWSDKTRSV